MTPYRVPPPRRRSDPFVRYVFALYTTSIAAGLAWTFWVLIRG